jgi:hypothetical protein
VADPYAKYIEWARQFIAEARSEDPPEPEAGGGKVHRGQLVVGDPGAFCIYIGSARAAGCRAFLEESEITRVVNCAEDRVPNHFEGEPGGAEGSCGSMYAWS